MNLAPLPIDSWCYVQGAWCPSLGATYLRPGVVCGHVFRRVLVRIGGQVFNYPRRRIETRLCMVDRHRISARADGDT